MAVNTLLRPQSYRESQPAPAAQSKLDGYNRPPPGPFFPPLVTVAAHCVGQDGIDTMIATMPPCSIALIVSWTDRLILWNLLTLPIRPGSGLFLSR